jgi:hypothetical protein
MIDMYMVEKFISHRGNLVHKDLNRENKIASIMNVIEKGFDCEIDIWSIDNNLYLGHDKPDEKINIKTIFELKKNLWIHCKNLEGLNFFTENSIDDLNYFWHQQDDYTLTSLNFIWTYPNKKVSNNSVIVDLSHTVKIDKTIYGVCSDNIQDAKNLYY